MTGWLTKKRLFAFHGWLGITFGLPLFIICFAGACAVMAPEVDRMIQPDMRITPPSDPAARPLSWGTLVAGISGQCPGGEVYLMHAEREPDAAWTAVVNYSPRDSRLVYFDPFTGKVQSQRTNFNTQTFFRTFHKQFYITSGKYGPHGRVIVCAFSIVLLFSAATGLMFYKGWWKSLARLRIGKGMRIFLSDLHRFVGVWSFLLAILFAITGFWYLLERVMEDMGVAEHEPVPRISEKARSLRPPLVERLSLDELADRARAASPLRDIGMVILGNQPDAVTTFGFERDGLLADGESNSVHLDPYTGDVIEVVDAAKAGFGTKLESLVNPLHFGRFGGLLTKIIWTAAGLALAVGILAGAYIHWLRTRKARDGNRRTGRGWPVFSLVLNLMILGLAGVSTFGFIKMLIKEPLNPVSSSLLGDSQAGPWKVEASRQTGKGEAGGVSFHFTGKGEPNFRRAFCWTGDATRPDGLKPLKGSRTILYAKAEPGKALHLGIEGWDGTVHTASFADQPSQTPHVFRPLAASAPPSILWTIVGAFFIAAGAPAVIWLVRLR